MTSLLLLIHGRRHPSGVSAILIGLAVPSTAPLIAGGEKTHHYLATLWEGVRFLQHDALLVTIVVTVMITNLLDAAWASVVGPAYIKSVFHSSLRQQYQLVAR